MSKELIVLTAFPTVINSWNNIKNTILDKYEKPKNLNPFIFEYQHNDWDNFFINFYNISNKYFNEKERDDFLIKQDNSLDNSVETLKIFVRDHGNVKNYQNFCDMLEKGRFVRSYTNLQKMLAIPALISPENWREMMNLKNSIRSNYMKVDENLSKWSVIHSFHYGNQSLKVLEYINKNCKIVDWEESLK